MIEGIVAIAFMLIALLVRALNDAYIYIYVFNALISLSIVYILFCRVFMFTCKDKVGKANHRYLFLCVFYTFLIIEGFLALLFFSGELEWTYPNILRPAQILMYSISTIMFLYVKINDLKKCFIYGKTYLTLEIIDFVIIFTYLLFDYLVTPQSINNNPSIMNVAVFFMITLAIINKYRLSMMDYWEHKKILLLKIDQRIKHKKTKTLIDPKIKDINRDQIMVECRYVLDYAPIRVIEMNLLISQLRAVLLKNGLSLEDTTETISEFSSVIIRNLMKRKYDFYILPNYILNKLYMINKNSIKERRQLQ